MCALAPGSPACTPRRGVRARAPFVRPVGPDYAHAAGHRQTKSMHLGRAKHVINPRAWLTAAGAILAASSVPVFFEWGALPALLCALVGLALFLVGQTRPRQRGRHRWH